jgi:hypothetical protein
MRKDELISKLRKYMQEEISMTLRLREELFIKHKLCMFYWS